MNTGERGAFTRTPTLPALARYSSRATMSYPAIDLGMIAAVAFDVDGVVTDTARAHAQAWKQVFDSFLRQEAARRGAEFAPFDVRLDYLTFVDGKPRLDGVRSFLASRGFALPEDGAAGERTVRALGERKDRLFMAEVRRAGVAAFPATVALVRELRRSGVRTAAVSASRNCAEILRSAAVADMFDVRVDGVDAERLALPGKPDPAIFLEAARRLGVEPARTAVVEDALAGVEAGRRGGFGLVLGVDRRAQTAELYSHGADCVVRDLSQLWLVGRRPGTNRKERAAS